MLLNSSLDSFLRCTAGLTDFSTNDGIPYVVKPVSLFLYDQASRLQKHLSSSPLANFVRLPLDYVDDTKVLVFQNYTEDFLKFMHSVATSRSQIKRILLEVIKGIAACHSKDWIHSGKHQPHPISNLIWPMC